jgi:hypothetical protein
MTQTRELGLPKSLSRRPEPGTTPAHALELQVEKFRAYHTGAPDPAEKWSTEDWLCYELACARDAGHVELVRALSSEKISTKMWKKIRGIEKRAGIREEPSLALFGRSLARALRGPARYEELGATKAKDAIGKLESSAKRLVLAIGEITGTKPSDKRSWRLALLDAQHEMARARRDYLEVVDVLDAACIVFESPKAVLDLLDRAAKLWRQAGKDSALVTKTKAEGKTKTNARERVFVLSMASYFRGRSGKTPRQLIIDIGKVFFDGYFDSKGPADLYIPKTMKRSRA